MRPCRAFVTMAPAACRYVGLGEGGWRPREIASTNPGPLLSGVFTCLLSGHVFSRSFAAGRSKAAAPPPASVGQTGQSDRSTMIGIRSWMSTMTVFAFVVNHEGPQDGPIQPLEAFP
jgi:hypothetical protein